MKLKKIVSLALAGVLAVSMLAGCKNDGTDNAGSSSSQATVTTSKLADKANDFLTNAQEKVFTFNDNPTLNNALKSVATDKNKVTATIINTTFDGTVINVLSGQNNGLAGNVADKFTSGTYFAGSSKWSSWINVVPTNAEKADSYIEVSVLSGLMTEEAVAKAVVDRWSAHMNSSTFNTTVSNYDMTYSADIAAVKVYNSSDDSKTAWVVAVMINKTATETKNAEV